MSLARQRLVQPWSGAAKHKVKLTTVTGDGSLVEPTTLVKAAQLVAVTPCRILAAPLGRMLALTVTVRRDCSVMFCMCVL